MSQFLNYFTTQWGMLSKEILNVGSKPLGYFPGGQLWEFASFLRTNGKDKSMGL